MLGREGSGGTLTARQPLHGARAGEAITVLIPFLACALVAMAASPAAADILWGPSLTFPGYYTIPGLNFTAPVQDQGEWGTCGAFGRTYQSEAAYELTRNDPTFSLLLSQQMDVNGAGGVGRVLQTELPYSGGDPYSYTNNCSPSQWPLPVGWQNRMVPAATNYYNASGIADMQYALETYGPVDVGVCAEDYYTLGGSVPTPGGVDHNNVVVGFHNATSSDPAAVQAAGGYWITENSWSSGWGYGGYGLQLYS